ncbi:hypothetical protein D9758_004403 [Tetrapyrgos nigripes]|uniref:FAD-binding PCMH-type domain-containing protein n=1 Tax=Tetrapyrgos nigripes TaxID=182062 RepID=A0A8H5GN15_9AGAR|nr:hypothetical protein D9758_004403 [Tetrapyrgos nigripes]
MMLKHPNLALLSLAFSAIATSRAQEDPATKACQLLAETLPGLVFFPGTSNYTSDNFHYGASSTQNSTCTVEPSTNDDVSAILKIVGREDVRSPFAVKGAGHTSNVGFSSTTGVMVSLVKFDQITVNDASTTVTVGPGATWDQVYVKLEPLNLTVVGGRIPGVGVGGLLLGGGYSWFTDQFGLAVDNVVSYDLVLPNGTLVQVTDYSQPDLSFALKGGYNNFGIVTAFTLKSHPINGIWGGTLSFSANDSEQVFSAVERFSMNNSDPKAALILTYVNVVGLGPLLVADVIYGEPVEQPPAAFEEILSLPLEGNTAKSRTLTDFTLEEFTVLLSPQIGYTQHVIPTLHYTVPILRAMKTQVDAALAKAIADGRSVASVGMNCEPYINDFAHSVDSAYPHSPSRPVTPGNPLSFYNDVSDRDYFEQLMRGMSEAIQAVTIQEGQGRRDDIHYPNYALGDTPVELIYGENLPRLREIKGRVDPEDVMGLSGGFKV